MSGGEGRPVQGRLGLALGGGGARALAHLGVLEVLEEFGLRPDLIAGVSFGALIGAVYAHEPDAAGASARIAAAIHSDAYRSSRLRRFGESGASGGGAFSDALRALFGMQGAGTGAARSGILDREECMLLINGVVPEVDLRDLRIPFAAVAADLVTGEEVVLDSGPARTAVAASSAVPGVVPPVAQDGRLLVDGGSLNKLPARVLRERGADFVVGVDLSVWSDLEDGSGMGAAEVAFRATDMVHSHLLRLQADECDALIRVGVEAVHWADFDQMERCVEAGRREAKSFVPGLAKGPDGAP